MYRGGSTTPTCFLSSHQSIQGYKNGYYIPVISQLWIISVYRHLLNVLQTSNTLGFLLYELASHPEKQQRLRDEVEMVVRECGDNLKLEDLQKMKYFKMCLKETLRLYPILYVNGRSIRSHFISENHNIEFKAKVSYSKCVSCLTVMLL